MRTVYQVNIAKSKRKIGKLLIFRYKADSTEGK